ncbi:MAG TPA: carboxypeptidase regulatory-like domain-containing protein [Terriglobales bacterium]
MKALSRNLCAVGIVLFSLLVWAQNSIPQNASGKASVTGAVTDSTGAVIAGATVAVKSGATVVQTGTSNEKGEYAIKGLPAGTYTVAVSAPGFKDFLTDGLTLMAGQELPIDAMMEPAGVTTEVNVEGQKVSQVETETSQLSGTITEKELVKLGLNGRNFTQLIALTPGVSNQTSQDEATVGVTGSVKYSVNGGRVEYNSFNVDGGDVLNAGLNKSDSTLIVYPSLDALSEVQVLTSNYGAQYGRTASGTVLADIKTGGNKFHGNAYEFIRNEFFNARNYFDITDKAPLYRRNDFGGTIGGPLYIPNVYNTNKDKTFVFFSEEFRFERTPTDYNQAVPSLAERQGNFSDVCPFALPGTGGLPGGIANFTRAQYPDCPGIPNGTILPPNSTGCPSVSPCQQFETYQGNQVPIDPTAQLLLGTNVIPAATSTIGCSTTAPSASCFDAVVSPNTYWREELFKIDHNINSKMKASFHYIHDEWKTTVLTPQWGVVINSFPTIQNSFTGPGINMLARVTNTITPTFLNDFVFSYTTDHITMNTLPSPLAQWERPSDLSMGYIFNNGFGGKIPGIVISGNNQIYGSLGFAVDPGYLPWHHSNPTYNISDSVSKVWGKHTLQIGGLLVVAQRNELNQAVGANTGDLQGILTYSNEASLNSTGNAFADFLLGSGTTSTHAAIKSFQQDSAQFNYFARYTTVEPYVQDDWRVSQRLTLNLGLRMSIFGNWHEKYNNIYNWVPSAFSHSLAGSATIDTFNGGIAQAGTCANGSGGNCTPIPINLGSLSPIITNGLQQCGVNGVPNGCMSPHLFNPAPRVGFAWDPKGDGKMSIRAGYGIFFEHGVGNEANTGSLEGSAPIVLNMTQENPFTYQCIGGVGQGCAPSGAFPLNVTAIPTKTTWPYVQQWSFSIQREFAKNTVATLAYVGSKGTHLAAEVNPNQLTPVAASENPFPQGVPITSAVCNSFTGNSFTIVQPGVGVQSVFLNEGQPGFTNLEAACYGTPGDNRFPAVNSLRTYAPTIGNIFSLQNIADSKYNAMQATMRRVQGPLTVGFSYTWSHAIDDASDRSDATLVNAFDLGQNRASSNYDQRQLLNVAYVYQLPKLSDAFRRALDSDPNPNSTAPEPAAREPSRFMQSALDGWEVSGITVYQSGTPFSVYNGASANGISVIDNAGMANGLGSGTQTEIASYPDVGGNPHGVPPPGSNNIKSFGPTLLNPEAFVAPTGLTLGDTGRNFLNNPGRLNWDAALAKHWRVTEGSNLELRWEVFNVFNHTQFRIYDPAKGNTGSNVIACYGGYNNSAGDVSCLNGSAFLHPVDAHRARTMQFGLKYAF